MSNHKFKDRNILERLTKYKDGNYVIKNELASFLIKFGQEIEFFKSAATEIQNMIEDMLITPNEFELLDMNLRKLQQNSIENENLLQENKDYLQDLIALAEKSDSFISKFNVVTDLFTMSGYVQSKDFDSLFYLNLKKLKKILDDIEKICEKTENIKKNRQINNYITIIEEYINYLPYILEDFAPHIAHITLPNSVEFLEQKAKELKKLAENFSILTSKKFLNPNIENAILGLDLLKEDFKNVYNGEPIKLKKFMMKKKGATKMEDLIKVILSLF